MDILGRITELRLKKGWTEYELAKQSDLAQTTISSWYNKNMLPSYTSLEKVCIGLGITLSEFFSEDGKIITLTEEQRQFLDKFNALDNTEKEKLNIFLDAMLIHH